MYHDKILQYKVSDKGSNYYSNRWMNRLQLFLSPNILVLLICLYIYILGLFLYLPRIIDLPLSIYILVLTLLIDLSISLSTWYDMIYYPVLRSYYIYGNSRHIIPDDDMIQHMNIPSEDIVLITDENIIQQIPLQDNYISRFVLNDVFEVA